MTCQPAAAAMTHHTGPGSALRAGALMRLVFLVALVMVGVVPVTAHAAQATTEAIHVMAFHYEIGRASCRERV